MRILFCAAYVFASCTAFAQRSVGVIVPVVFNTLTVRNNYGPPRDINGNVLTTGAIVRFTFQPAVLRNKKLFLILGAGYLSEKFTLTRPFVYGTATQVLFYTKNYSYSNLAALAALRYSRRLRRHVQLNIAGNYYWLNSFRQTYTPTYTAGAGPERQTKTDHFTFGFSTNVSIGLERRIGRWSYGVDVVFPVYSLWRKDPIFQDNPADTFSPKGGVGANAMVSHYLK